MWAVARHLPMEGDSAYLPDTCLQGANLPAHVLWSGGDPTEVSVEYPPDPRSGRCTMQAQLPLKPRSGQGSPFERSKFQDT